MIHIIPPALDPPPLPYYRYLNIKNEDDDDDYDFDINFFDIKNQKIFLSSGKTKKDVTNALNNVKGELEMVREKKSKAKKA